MSNESNEATLRRYLLADLNEAEREEIEVRLFSDEAFEEELTRAENDLIDNYVSNALPPRDCELFRQNFILNDERRKNLVFAQTLDAYLEQEIDHPAEPLCKSWWKAVQLFLKTHKGWAMATATAIVLFVFLVPVALRWLRFDDEFAFKSTSPELMQRRVTDLNRKPLSSERGVQVSLQPSSLLRGSGDITQIKIAKEVKMLDLTFALTSKPYNKYMVTARTVEGDELFTITDLSPKTEGEASVFLRIPAEFLPTNDFQFEVKGIAADGQSIKVELYNLRVLH